MRPRRVVRARSGSLLGAAAESEHGVRFDNLVRDARVQLHGAQMQPRKGWRSRRTKAPDTEPDV